MPRLIVSGLSVGLACAFVLGNASAATIRLSDCESNVCGGDWTLNGNSGSARWAGGTVAELSIERREPDHIIIHRKDIGGPTAGVTAVYTGAFAVVQNGASVFTLSTGRPAAIAFRGAFKSPTAILGHSCGPSAHAENPDCLP